MEIKKRMKGFVLTFGILLFTFLISCNTNDDTDAVLDNINLIQSDKDALLFMLEEEKLARDTYIYLDNLWSINVFGNIKNSEQAHMDAIANLLDNSLITYSILPEGEFLNQELQNYYNLFVANGSISQDNALQIGATIEDLDIVDLERFMGATTNSEILAVFNSLQCGSRNHIRSFVSAIENNEATYEPQFLTQEEYNQIINNANEQCNQTN